MKINTHYDPSPIPTSRFDWCATLDNYEGGDIIGYGKIKDEAIEELLDQIDDEDMYQELKKEYIGDI